MPFKQYAVPSAAALFTVTGGIILNDHQTWAWLGFGVSIGMFIAFAWYETWGKKQSVPGPILPQPPIRRYSPRDELELENFRDFIGNEYASKGISPGMKVIDIEAVKWWERVHGVLPQERTNDSAANS